MGGRRKTKHTVKSLRAALEAGKLSERRVVGAARLGHRAACKLTGIERDPQALDPQGPVLVGLEELPPRTLIAWCWETVSQALGAHADELRETGVRIPLRGIMLMLWRVVEGHEFLEHQSQVALEDTRRVGTVSGLSPLLREGVLGIHFLARACLAPDAVEANDPPGSLAWFVENLCLATDHACAADPSQRTPARERLIGWLLAH